MISAQVCRVLRTRHEQRKKGRKWIFDEMQIAAAEYLETI